MIKIAAIAALIAAVALALLSAAQSRRAEKRWPQIGRMVTVERARLHVIERGAPDAPPVLLLHGASANAREWLHSVAPLLEVDHRLLMVDRPGYGYSSRPARAQRLETQARLMAGLLDADAPQGAIVVAHSLGAAVALRLALDRPELVRGIVLAAPASHPYPGGNAWWANLAAAPVAGEAFSYGLVPLANGAAQGAIRNTFRPARPPATYYEEAGVGLAFRGGAFRASALDVTASKREFAAQAPRYPEIWQPTIIITSDRDRVVSPHIHARALAEDLQAAELVTAPRSGHMPHQIRPDLVAAAVRRVEEIDASRAAE
ncbi:MAG: alpha/beta fold hydrolase [Alphaproteobacteria bacterium]|nr:alpha/beta fold hydrolase [Alphaproteobacteria bacterium]